MHKLGLTVCNNFLDTPCTFDHTFAAESRKAYSLIDHIFVTNIMPNFVLLLVVINDVDNFSDHLPVKLELDKKVIDFCRDNTVNIKSLSSAQCSNALLLDWSNSNVSAYYELTRCELLSLNALFSECNIDSLKLKRPDIFTQTGINDIYRNIIHVLMDCSFKTICNKSATSVKKFWWDNSLKDAKSESMKQFNNWIAAGKPGDGPLFVAKNLARKVYKNAIHKSKEKSKNSVTNKLQKNLLNANSNKFWRCWKGYFKPGNDNKTNVNGLKDNKDIADYLANSFQSACTPNSESKQKEFKEKYFSNKSQHVNATEQFSIDVELVCTAIDKIDHNKAPGFDSLTIEHIAYAHPSIVVILRMLFNILLHTGQVPDDFGIGVTTPIPKFKGNKKLTTADDYRGITICPVVSKIFEYCILINFDNISTSERQFGFKKSIGCQNSLHTVRKVVNYFNHRKSTVNIGVIDLKKAFDKCNIFGVLRALQDNNIDVKIINVLENWFSKSCTTIKWNNIFSKRVPLLTGVKQGGILSPLLFSLFVDVVLTKLEQSCLGCFIGQNCWNSYMYADDLILLSITVTDLQKMLNLCADVFSNLDLPINVSKCHCLRIGPRCNVDCSPLSIEGEAIHWVESTKYLGITLCKSKIFKCDWVEPKNKYYRNCNVIFGRLGNSASTPVILKLVHSQGVQNLLYGISATTLSESEIKSFSHAYNSLFAKVYKTFDNKVINCCQYYSGYLCFDMLYELNRYLFLCKLLNRSHLDKQLEVDKSDYRDYLRLQAKYSFNVNDSPAAIKFKLWDKFKDKINQG
jgi:hypothetical protein